MRGSLRCPWSEWVGEETDKIPGGSIHTFTRLAMTRLTFSCGTKQSTTEFAAQRGPQQEFWLSCLNRLIILLMHEPLALFCQDVDYRRDIIILAQLRWDFLIA